MHVLACVISKLHIFDQVSGSRVTNALFTRGFPLDKIIKMTSMLPYIKLLFRIICNIDFPHLSITLDHILLANSGAVHAQVVYEPVWKVMETRATGWVVDSDDGKTVTLAAGMTHSDVYEPARKVMVVKTGGENESDRLRAVDSNDSETRATIWEKLIAIDLMWAHIVHACSHIDHEWFTHG